MIKILIYSILILLIIINTTSSAYSNENLNLSKCIKYGLSNSHIIKKSENNLSLSKYKKMSSYGALLPNIEGGVEYIPYNKKYQYVFENQYLYDKQISKNSIAEQVISDASIYINASMNIYDGLGRINKIKTASLEYKSFEKILNRDKEQMIYDVYKRYYQLMLDMELLDIAIENFNLSHKLYDKIKALVSVGNIPVSDQYQQQTKLSENALLVIERRNVVLSDKISILNLIGMDTDPQSVVFEKIKLPVINKKNILNKNMLIMDALNKRSDYLSQEYLTASSIYSIKSAKSELYPSINIIAQLSTNTSEIKSLKVNNKYVELIYNDNQKYSLFDNISYLYGIDVRMKIFDGFTTQYNIQKSKIDYLNKKYETEQLRRNITGEIILFIAEYEKNVQKMEATEVGLISAMQAYDIMSKRYDLGLSDYTELSEAYVSLFKSKSERIQSLYLMEFHNQIISYYTGSMDIASY